MLNLLTFDQHLCKQQRVVPLRAMFRKRTEGRGHRAVDWKGWWTNSERRESRGERSQSTVNSPDSPPRYLTIVSPFPDRASLLSDARPDMTAGNIGMLLRRNRSRRGWARLETWINIRRGWLGIMILELRMIADCILIRGVVNFVVLPIS